MTSVMEEVQNSLRKYFAMGWVAALKVEVEFALQNKEGFHTTLIRS